MNKKTQIILGLMIIVLPCVAAVNLYSIPATTFANYDLSNLFNVSMVHVSTSGNQNSVSFNYNVTSYGFSGTTLYRTLNTYSFNISTNIVIDCLNHYSTSECLNMLVNGTETNTWHIEDEFYSMDITYTPIRVQALNKYYDEAYNAYNLRNVARAIVYYASSPQQYNDFIRFRVQ